MRNNTVSLLLGVGRLIKSRMHAVLPLSYTMSETLRLLSDGDRVTMRDIAKHFNITAPSATAIVADLVRRRLVTRAENKDDRREVILHATKEGKALMREIEKKREKVFSSVLSVLSPADRAQLDVVLEKLLAEHSN